MPNPLERLTALSHSCREASDRHGEIACLQAAGAYMTAIQLAIQNEHFREMDADGDEDEDQNQQAYRPRRGRPGRCRRTAARR
jgi:hypothetical protein